MASAFGERIFCYVTYKVKAGKMQECIAALNEAKIAERYREQPGNVIYDFVVSTEEPNRIYLVDMWENQETFDAHQMSDVVPDMAAIKEQYIEETKLLYRFGGQ